MGEATLPLLNLLITGKASPYLHNGIMTVEGEDGEVRTLFSYTARCTNMFYYAVHAGF